MNKKMELLDKRNLLGLRTMLIWTTIWFLSMILVGNVRGGLVFGFRSYLFIAVLFYFFKKKILIRWIPYIVLTGQFVAGILSLLQDPNFLLILILLFIIGYANLFQNWKAILLGTFYCCFTTTFFFFRNPEMFSFLHSKAEFVLILLIFIALGLCMFFQLIFIEKIRKKAEENEELALLNKQKVENHLSFITQSFHELSSFNEKLNKNIHLANESSSKKLILFNEIDEGVNHQTNDVKKITQLLKNNNDFIENTTSLSLRVKEMSNLTKNKINSVTAYTNDLRKRMNTIENSFEQTMSLMNHLENRNKDIEQVISIIQNIFNQIKILAINAAIESERSGGKMNGFKTIADEMKKLAETSSNNIKTISNIFNEIMRQTTDVSTGILDGRQQLNKSNGELKNINIHFNEIADNSIEVDNFLSKLSELMNFIGRSSDEILIEANKISIIAENNSSLIEKIKKDELEQHERIDEISNDFDTFEREVKKTNTMN